MEMEGTLKQEWFEMRDIRKKRFDGAVWIPLREYQREEYGRSGYLGHQLEIVCVSSVAIPVEKMKEAESLGWDELGLRHSHRGWFCGARYVPADIFEDNRIGQGTLLVLKQEGNKMEPPTWHLHQDFAISLNLKREGNVWRAVDEGYDDVVRLHVDERGKPHRLEVRAEYLKDYLCARDMGLYISSYRCREEVVKDRNHITWPESLFRQMQNGGDHWEGRVLEIHEGGHPFGSSIAVFQVVRTNIDPTEDVPKISPLDEGIESRAWTKESTGQKLYLIEGELWRNEWVEPAEKSPRVRRDKISPSVFFIADAKGTRESSQTLEAGGRWLWFRPGVMTEIVNRRGGFLRWYTRDTGTVGCSPDNGLHFGMNKLGLVNAYAKDIALLSDWQQRIWAGFNLGPEGGVSEELLGAQARGIPADTQAPEELLSKGIELLNEVSDKRLGFCLIRQHAEFEDILSRTHRFRAVDQVGLYSLAKDIARLTTETIDLKALLKIVPPIEGPKLGSLKALEKILSMHIGTSKAYSLLGPLHGVYNLRMADAHLPSSDLEEALRLVAVDKTQPFVLQGFQMLNSIVSSLYLIIAELEHVPIQSALHTARNPSEAMAKKSDSGQ